MKTFEDGYIISKIGSSTIKIKGNEFKLKHTISDNTLTLKYLDFNNQLQDGSEYEVIEETLTTVPVLDEEGVQLLDENDEPLTQEIIVRTPVIKNYLDFNDLVDLDVNGEVIQVQFTSGVATLDLTTYTEHTIIKSNLEGVDNIIVELNKPYEMTTEDMVKYNYLKAKGVI